MNLLSSIRLGEFSGNVVVAIRSEMGCASGAIPAKFLANLLELLAIIIHCRPTCRLLLFFLSSHLLLRPLRTQTMSSPRHAHLRALVPVANGTEDMECVTVIDILRRANMQVMPPNCLSLFLSRSRGFFRCTDVLYNAVIHVTCVCVCTRLLVGGCGVW